MNTLILPKKNFRLGELFSGPGGIGYAATTISTIPGCSTSPAWATDYDPDSCKTYERNIANSKGSVVCKDIRELNFASLKSISDIEAMAFGFPCNDFSAVGERKGVEGNFGPLYRSNFFPPKPNHFQVLTDDGESFVRVRAQKNDVGSAIETPHNNSLLGRYFRKRLGLPSGAFITKDHLAAYGRKDVTFFKLDEDNYGMDFSVSKINQ